MQYTVSWPMMISLDHIRGVKSNHFYHRDCFVFTPEIADRCISNPQPGENFYQCYREARFPCPGVVKVLIAQNFVDMALEFCELADQQSAIEINLFPGGDCQAVLRKSALQNLMKDETQASLQSRPLSYKSAYDFSARRSIKGDTRIFGASTYPTIRNEHSTPWMCSLRTRGYRGRHRCGVTLLSGISFIFILSSNSFFRSN